MSFFHSPFSEHQKMLLILPSEYVQNLTPFLHSASLTLDPSQPDNCSGKLQYVAFPKSLPCFESGFPPTPASLIIIEAREICLKI